MVESYICPQGKAAWPHQLPEDKELYNRHFAKHGIGPKAIVAVARKLAIKTWRLAMEPPPTSMGDAASGGRSPKRTEKRAAFPSTGADQKRYLVTLHHPVRHE